MTAKTSYFYYKHSMAKARNTVAFSLLINNNFGQERSSNLWKCWALYLMTFLTVRTFNPSTVPGLESLTTCAGISIPGSPGSPVGPHTVKSLWIWKEKMKRKNTHNTALLWNVQKKNTIITALHLGALTYVRGEVLQQHLPRLVSHNSDHRRQNLALIDSQHRYPARITAVSTSSKTGQP